MGDPGRHQPEETEAPVLSARAYRSAKIIALFLSQIPIEFARLEAAILAGDSVTVRLVAHKLKGSCRAIGVPRMALLCEALDRPVTDVSDAMRQYRLLVIEHEVARVLLEREQLGLS